MNFNEIPSFGTFFEQKRANKKGHLGDRQNLAEAIAYIQQKYGGKVFSELARDSDEVASVTAKATVLGAAAYMRWRRC